ncbi:hypothetical protein DRH14_01360, partial [Candidatus Shapirobacteria bacterium]
LNTINLPRIHFLSPSHPNNQIPTITPTPTPIKQQTIIANNGSTEPSQPNLPTPTIIRHQIKKEYPPVDADVGVARSGQIRFKVEWPRAINAFYKNPLLGTGLGSLGLATDNDYLRILGESGILAFISFFAIPFFLIIKTLKIKKTKHKWHLIMLSALLTTLANATFIDVFEASKTAYLFWIMIGVYYQILNFYEKEK